MGVPLSQMTTVASYVVRQKLKGRRRFPLVLMLEPLLRCNLACAGCGKIQHPPEILRRQLSPDDCFRAVDECGAPIVSIAGGEPLLHPQIEAIIEGIKARRRYLYLCTNGIKLKEFLPRFSPSKYLTLSVHIDGLREEHDRSVDRAGVFDSAVEAMREAVAKGFRVTTNTTIFDGDDPRRLRRLFDEMMGIGVEGMMISPGYSYRKAPDQTRFLTRLKTERLFRRALSRPARRWRFNQSPLFLEFLKGNWKLECTPWGNPTYNVFGWQRPCYLLDEGYCESFAELLATTAWQDYGRASGNPSCQDCMVHCGYEATAVVETFSSLRALVATAAITLFGPSDRGPRDRASADTVLEESSGAPDSLRDSGNLIELPVINN